MDLPPDPLPLVIGVTGHRDLRDEDLPRLEQEVGVIIASLRRDYLRNDPETPVVILSALAEGADQLVTRVALAQGARLIAPLPLPAAEYRRDFEPGLKPGAAAEFDRLLAQAVAAPVMPLSDGMTLEAVRTDSSRRSEQYRAVGAFIAQHCHVLIALWDGNDHDMAKGGTAEIVDFKRDGIPPSLSPSARAALDASEIGPVIHVVTPRVKNPDVVISVRPWGSHVAKNRRRHGHSAGVIPSLQEKEASAWHEFAALVVLTRRFNAEAAALARTPEGPQRLQKSLAGLFWTADPKRQADADAARLRAGQIAPHWCGLYAAADALAQVWQQQFRTDWLFLFAFGLSALLFFELKAHLLHNAVWLLLGYGGLLFALAGWLRYARRSQHQQRFLDYRALAEALRVAIFWKLAAIDARSEDRNRATGFPAEAQVFTSIADAYPIKQPSELAWVKLCLRALELLDCASNPTVTAPQAIDSESYAWGRELWIGGQLAYFSAKSHSHHETAERRERLSLVLLLIAPILAGGLLWLYYFGGGVDERSIWHYKHWVHELVVFSIGMLSGVAAALAGHTEQLALKAQARQYDRMRVLFERAYMVLPDSLAGTTPKLAQAVLVEIGSEAMKENAEWVAIYRQRPIRAPQG